MRKFELTTTGLQADYLANLLRESSRHGAAESCHEESESFNKWLKPLPAGKLIVVYATTFGELCQLNGLSCTVVDEYGKDQNLAVPNFLADRLELEPLGHERGLEVFGQELYIKAVPLHPAGFVICTVDAITHGRGDGSSYWTNALWLAQDKSTRSCTYPITHAARTADRFPLLYAKAGSWRELEKELGRS